MKSGCLRMAVPMVMGAWLLIVAGCATTGTTLTSNRATCIDPAKSPVVTSDGLWRARLWSGNRSLGS